MSAFSLQACRDGWDQAARENPIGNILTDTAYTPGEFFQTGRDAIADTFAFWDAQGIERPASGRALDFGCGLGRLTRALAGHYDAVGVDISKEMIDRAQAGAPKGCTFAVNEGRELRQFADDSFSLVYTLIVLQHMPTEFQRSYVEEFIRVTRPGGLLYFQIPDGPGDLPYTSWLTMYGASLETVTGWVEGKGGEIVVVEKTLDSGAWDSYRYTARVRDVSE